MSWDKFERRFKKLNPKKRKRLSKTIEALTLLGLSGVKPKTNEIFKIYAKEDIPLAIAYLEGIKDDDNEIQSK